MTIKSTVNNHEPVLPPTSHCHPLGEAPGTRTHIRERKMTCAEKERLLEMHEPRELTLQRGDAATRPVGPEAVGPF